jgi:hypothetical protein
VAHGKVNHALGWINAENRTLRKSSHDFRSDLSIAASEIEKSLRSVEMQQGEHFGGHGLLKSPPPTLFFGIPFLHCESCKSGARSSMGGPFIELTGKLGPEPLMRQFEQC